MTGPEVSNTVHSTGDGTVVQVGTLNGDINLLTGTPVRTRYREQVKRIAPPALEDRAAELAELAAFCTSAETAGSYAWWRAEAWSAAAARRGDHDRALSFALAVKNRTLRPATILSTLDAALTAGDVRVAAVIAEMHVEPAERPRVAVAVARLSNDAHIVRRMADLVADPEEQASVWLSVPKAIRRKSVANAIRLARWHLGVEAVVEEDPTAFELVMAELEALRGYPRI